jgi:RHS repeat-associated protein
MLMPGRKYPAAGGLYRYGFNGKENDNEVKGEGNQQDYGMRIYDPRLVRFLSVDPLQDEYPELTPYQFASDNPITFIDRDGEEAAYKMPDGSIYVQPPSDHNIVRIPQNVQAYGVYCGSKRPDATLVDRITSVFLDFVPYVGPTKMAIEFVFGTDIVTGESSPRLASLPIIKEVRGINKLVRAENQLQKAVNETQKSVTKSEKVILGKDNAIVKNKNSNDKTDFIVTPDGTAVPKGQDRMREGFDKAGFPKKAATETSEKGVTYTVPVKNGKVDVRTMEGSSNHPKRSVITHPNTNSPKTPSGKATSNKKDNHIEQH